MLKDSLKNAEGYGVTPDMIKNISNAMPEFEKVFDHSKINKLVDGAFKADINHTGHISLADWTIFMQTGSYKEQWVTIALMFDSYQ